MKAFKLKPSKLALATSLALAALSGQALAAVTTDPLNTPAQIDVYLSGASAPQNVLKGIAENLFGSNSTCPLDDSSGATPAINENFCNYHTLRSSSASDFRAYYGNLQSAQTINGRTLSAGTSVLLTHRAKGGSVHGVNPVALSFPLEKLVVGPSCTFIAGNNGVSGYDYSCTTTGTDGTDNGLGRRPDFGVSDVAPFMFKANYNKEPGTGVLFDALSASDVAKLNGGTGKVAFQLMFGVPATNAVPGSFALNGTTVTGFTTGMFASLLAGQVTNWNQIQPTTSPLTGNTSVVVCRRAQGSGTQATYNAYFNKWPCTEGSVIPGSNTAPSRQASSVDARAQEYDEFGNPDGFVPGNVDAGAGLGINPNTVSSTITIDPTLGFTVVENPSSGNVRDCLHRAQNHLDHTISWKDDSGFVHTTTIKFSNSANPFRAVGVLSNDSREGDDGASPSVQQNTWSFRELNGVAGMTGVSPNRLANKEAVRNGAWDFAAEATMQYRTDGYIGVDGAFHAGAAPAGVEQQRRDFIDLFIQKSGEPGVLGTISNASTAAAAVATPSLVNDARSNANVSFVTRDGNLCKPQRWFKY